MGTIQDQVSGVFSSVGNDLQSILIAFAAIALPVFILFLGFRYGRRIFNKIIENRMDYDTWEKWNRDRNG